MITVLLAAGMATRLRPLTDDRPKCLLDIGGASLLFRTLESLRSRGLTDIVLVTGYRGEMIRRAVRSSFPGLSIRTVDNPGYAGTNNIVSLFLARPLVEGEEMFLLDSDILFDPRIIDLLLRSPSVDRLAVTSGRPLGAEEIKVRVDAGGSVTEIGKHVDPAGALGESIGMELFGREFVRDLFVELERIVEGEGQTGLFYEAAFQAVIDRGRRPAAVDVGEFPCIEIDTPADLEVARMLVTRLGS